MNGKKTHTHTRLQYDINVQQKREKKRQAVVFVSSFHPRGGVFCCSWRDEAVFFFFRGGTGRFAFFSEAGRGGFLFFFRRDGTGRCLFFIFRGPGRDGCFWRWQFFWRDGAKSLHRPAKGGLNRPASRPCKALKFLAFFEIYYELPEQICDVNLSLATSDFFRIFEVNEHDYFYIFLACMTDV